MSLPGCRAYEPRHSKGGGGTGADCGDESGGGGDGDGGEGSAGPDSGHASSTWEELAAVQQQRRRSEPALSLDDAPDVR